MTEYNINERCKICRYAVRIAPPRCLHPKRKITYEGQTQGQGQTQGSIPTVAALRQMFLPLDATLHPDCPVMQEEIELK